MSHLLRPIFLMLAMAACAALGGCQTGARLAWNIPAGVKTMTVNGYPMAYVERGSGPTAVFVPGTLNDYRYWAPQLQALSSQFRVISVSLRHYYPEHWDGEGSFSIKEHAQDLASFIERLKVGPVDIIAWSRGGAVAVDLVNSRPDLVKKLVLMDATLYALVPERISKERAVRAKTIEAYFRNGQLEEGLHYYFDDVNGPGSWSRLSADQRASRLDNAWTVIGGINDVETVTCADIRRFKTPVLLMEDEKSPAWRKHVRMAFQACLPSASFVSIPEANRQISQANPANADTALIRFLSED